MEIEELKELILDIRFIIAISDSCTKKLANLSVRTMNLLNAMQREESFLQGQRLALNLTSSVNQSASDDTPIITNPSSELSDGNHKTEPVTQLTEEEAHNINYCTIPQDVGALIGEVASVERKIHQFTEIFKRIEKKHNANVRLTVDDNSGEIIDLSTKASGEIIDLTGDDSPEILDLTTKKHRVQDHTDNLPVDLSTSGMNTIITNLPQSASIENVYSFEQDNDQVSCKESDVQEKSKRELQNYDAELFMKKRFKMGVESAPSSKKQLVKNPYHREVVVPQSLSEQEWVSSDDEEPVNMYLPRPQSRPACRSPASYKVQHSSNNAPKLGPMYEDPLEGPSGLCNPPPEKDTYSNDSTDETDEGDEAAYTDYLRLMEISDHESRDQSPCNGTSAITDAINMQRLLNALSKLQHTRSNSPDL